MCSKVKPEVVEQTEGDNGHKEMCSRVEPGMVEQGHKVAAGARPKTVVY